MLTMWCLCDPTPSDSLDLDVSNRERTRLHLFQFSLRDQASNWLERLLAGSVFTWEDLTTRFLAQFFPPGRTAKLYNDILMFQQHQGESLSEAWTRFKDLLQNVPRHGINRWIHIQIFYDHVSFHLKCETDRAAGGKLRHKNIEESWEIIKDLALYDHEGWNDSRDFVKPVKAVSTSQKEARHPVTIHINSISLIIVEEEENVEGNEVVNKNVMEPDRSDAAAPPKEVDKMNGAKNRT
ncbi:zinc finger, CCHC-type containing protein [Tanacetum coccineum]